MTDPARGGRFVPEDNLEYSRPHYRLEKSARIKAPIRFADKRFDIVIAQGVFEYIGDSQDQVRLLRGSRGRSAFCGRGTSIFTNQRAI